MRIQQRALVGIGVIATCALVVAGCGGGGGGYGGGGGGGTPAPVPPTITLAAPTAATVNRTVVLTATPTAAAGVTRVEFLVDGTVIANVTVAPYTANWDTSAVTNGAHDVAARVTDANNAAVTTAAKSITVNNNPTIHVVLSPDETVPHPTSTASGSGDVTFNLLTGAVTGGVTVSGVTATLAHIHDAFAGSSGPIIVNFVQNGGDPNRWDAVAGGTLTAEQIDHLLAGELYVNVHSAAYPAGEIRGQLKPDNISVVFTAMTGTDVVPAVTTTATGMAATTVDSNASTATVHVNTTGVDDATDAHVHKAAAGANNAAALLTLTKDSVTPGHWSTELSAIVAADMTDFNANGWYVDVHTPAHPDGELRGQITPNPATTPPPPAATTLAELQSTIFTPRCSSCHSGGGGALPSSMNLSSAAASFAALVGVASVEQSALQRVKASDPDNSYIVHKLEGAAGITGSRMPLGGPFLDQATIDKVKSWITAGAANN
ncbi:MAG TPA: CHRD domain-containing protein [Steroidobacteraceae bacterium]|jgi:hypothetical protein